MQCQYDGGAGDEDATDGENPPLNAKDGKMVATDNDADDAMIVVDHMDND